MRWYPSFQLYILYSVKFGIKIFTRCGLCQDTISTYTWVGISGTTAKSRKRKFVPSSHPGPFALVASSHKSQTKVGTLACFDFFVKE